MNFLCMTPPRRKDGVGESLKMINYFGYKKGLKSNRKILHISKILHNEMKWVVINRALTHTHQHSPTPTHTQPKKGHTYPHPPTLSQRKVTLTHTHPHPAKKKVKLTHTSPHPAKKGHTHPHPAKKGHIYPHLTKKGHTHPHLAKKWSHPAKKRSYPLTHN